MDWGEVTDFVKILDRFNEPFFIEVHGLMDKTLSGSNIGIESVQTTSCRGVQHRENPFRPGFQYSACSWNEDWGHAFEGEGKKAHRKRI